MDKILNYIFIGFALVGILLFGLLIYGFITNFDDGNGYDKFN